MTDVLRAARHDVSGLDSGIFDECQLEPDLNCAPTILGDVRDLTSADLGSFDAIVHLANLSNDPLGTLDPSLTHEINVEATVRLARLAREAGIKRFVNSSSCSVYGDAVEPWVDESTPPRPVTAYGQSKLEAERRLTELSDDDFCVTSLRNATAFGYSPRLRLDLVVNDLVASAALSGQVRLSSDGSAWRPLVHIRDIARAFAQVLAAPPQRVNGLTVNVGSDQQNFRILDVARAVVAEVPGSELVIKDGATADRRSYRVRFGRLRQVLPDFACTHSLEFGIRELKAAYARASVDSPERFIRLSHLQKLLATGAIDERLHLPSAARA
jgi:nucleoside-diphosphate-sugar epimerase